MHSFRLVLEQKSVIFVKISSEVIKNKHPYNYCMKQVSGNSTDQYEDLSFLLSQQITRKYSTSFHSATTLFSNETRKAIQSIYGFVRLADEIVDTFHGTDKEYLLEKFESDYYDSYKQGISLNPLLHSFQLTVKKYAIDDDYIQDFLSSMKADLQKKEYKSQSEINDYIYGSADVVGLMCLRVFCKGDLTLFQSLVVPAMRLGSAFQKVNFLRDIKEDIQQLGRFYFPQVSVNKMDEDTKAELVKDIEKDFEVAYSGIRRLPADSRLAVIVAYKYYRRLLRKIKQTPATELMSKRIRVSDGRKFWLLITSVVKHKLNLE